MWNRRPTQPLEGGSAIVEARGIGKVSRVGEIRDSQSHPHPPGKVEASPMSHNTGGGWEEDAVVAFWQGKATHQGEASR